MNLVGLDGQKVRGSFLEDVFAHFTDRSHVTVCDLVSKIECGEKQCWIIDDDGEVRAAALSTIWAGEYPIAQITHLRGPGFKEYAHCFHDFEKWARDVVGCPRIKILAPPGYERFTKPLGFKKTHVLLEKDT